MQHTESLLFTAEQNDNLAYIKSVLNKDCIKLMDTLKLYETSSQENDALSIYLNEIESCSYCQYKMKTLSNLLSCLDQHKNEVTLEKNKKHITSAKLHKCGNH